MTEILSIIGAFGALLTIASFILRTPIEKLPSYFKIKNFPRREKYYKLQPALGTGAIKYKIAFKIGMIVFFIVIMPLFFISQVWTDDFLYDVENDFLNFILEIIFLVVRIAFLLLYGFLLSKLNDKGRK
jgi:hypothetical protein